MGNEQRVAFFRSFRLGDALERVESFGVATSQDGAVFSGTPNSSLAVVAEFSGSAYYQAEFTTLLIQNIRDTETSAAWRERVRQFARDLLRDVLAPDKSNVYTYSGDLVVVEDELNNVVTLTSGLAAGGTNQLLVFSGGPSFWGLNETVYLSDQASGVYEFATLKYDATTFLGPYVDTINEYAAGSIMARWEYRVPNAWPHSVSVVPSTEGHAAKATVPYSMTFRSLDDYVKQSAPAQPPTVAAPLNPALLLAAANAGAL